MSVNLGTMIGQSIAFFVFVWFCWKFIWPFLIRAMRERQQTIADGLEAAAKAQRDLEHAEARAEEILNEARAEARGIVDDARGQAAQMIDNARADAESERERILKAAQADVAQEVNRAKESLRGKSRTSPSWARNAFSRHPSIANVTTPCSTGSRRNSRRPIRRGRDRHPRASLRQCRVRPRPLGGSPDRVVADARPAGPRRRNGPGQGTRRGTVARARRQGTPVDRRRARGHRRPLPPVRQRLGGQPPPGTAARDRRAVRGAEGRGGEDARRRDHRGGRTHRSAGR